MIHINNQVLDNYGRRILGAHRIHHRIHKSDYRASLPASLIVIMFALDRATVEAHPALRAPSGHLVGAQ